MSEKIKKQCQSLHLSGLCQHFEAIFQTRALILPTTPLEKRTKAEFYN